ncbi:MAG: DMT family transporter [Lentisphaeria bacterium]|nr:DMT family transporter [Lentisphaeria bacterium]
MKKLFGSMAMLVATLLWGTAFSAQSMGMKFLKPMVFTTLRSVVGVAALAVIIIAVDLCRRRRISFWGNAATPAERKTLLLGGIFCGMALAPASICQQWGLIYTNVGKTGFLTALYIIIVPLAGIFFRRKTSPALWGAVLLALAGTYLLCGGIGNIGKGECFVIACSVIYSVHILVIDRYAPQCDCIRLSCIQFIVASLLAALGALIIREPWQTADISASLPFWVFCGVGSSAIAFTLQMTAQKYLHPVTATLIMSLESVFAVLGGWIFLHEHLNGIELLGCGTIFAAVILAQLPTKPAGKPPAAPDGRG